MDLRPAHTVSPETAFDRPTRSAPPVQRGPMPARAWQGWLAGGSVSRPGAMLTEPDAAPVESQPPAWEAVAVARRRRLLLAMLACTALAMGVLVSSQDADHTTLGQWIANGLFALLFAWVGGGFLTAWMGYRSLRHGDAAALDPGAVAGRAIAAEARTAIVMPVCNEDMASVSAGLRATMESLSRAGQMDRFDVFILSDSASPEQRRAEHTAWTTLRAALTADGYDASRLHIRWRQRRGRKKAGNVADFCRRWGRSFRYMVVLDADSVMSGEALLTLVRLMEAHPRAGILQTAPRSVGHLSLHARLQQFAGRLMGPLFAAGLRYWQMGESHYWGHNAILRVQPFMRHCALAPLSGRGGLAGDILSHDFVEAALMRRAGYEVWLLPELEGSFEQPPPHLIEELQRDRRWCQGNLQNARLVGEPGLAPVHRAMFVAGAMSYLASPLWLVFVLIGLLPWLTGGAGTAGTIPTDTGFPLAVGALWAGTLAMLFVPRVLAIVHVLSRGDEAGFGGRSALVRSAVLEAVIATLQAPVRMLAHSVFVVGALTGLRLDWKSPSREASDVSWREALRSFGIGAVLAAAGVAWWLAGAPDQGWKLLPLALPLVIAVPLAVWTSRPTVGAAWQRRGWLLTPEESRPPAVLRAAARHAGHASAACPGPRTGGIGGSPNSPFEAPTGACASAVLSACRWPAARIHRTCAGLSMAVVAATMVLPESVATGGLTQADLTAIRIVMQASSPSAEPTVRPGRLDDRGPLRMKRVALPARKPLEPSLLGRVGRPI